jgi:DNA helicase-2/ATP-dependent DNA helicase PcrA
VGGQTIKRGWPPRIFSFRPPALASSIRSMSRDYVLKPFQRTVELRIDYARELNEQQLAAVTAPPGPSLVIAGAGAGKTRTLIYRVAYLLEQGIPPERILLLTFTNKAAREMMRRVADLLGGDLSELWGGTFHAIGHRLLRRHAEQVGRQPDFTILDREDAKDLVSACLGEAEIDIKAVRFPKADVLAEMFSLAINTRRSIKQLLDEEYDYFTSLAPQIEELQRRYTERKRAANVVDFDDLLVLWLQLVQDHAEVRDYYQRRFQFLLVDEYQDTNKLQGDLIDVLAARHANVMVVGDDSQSIYSWRGAHYKNILEFPKRYPAAKVYKIETNYRSTPEILRVANAAIAPNVEQFTKQLTPVRKAGSKPMLVVCADANEQAAFVAQRVLELREEGTNLADMAVLYRSHFHALELQLELTLRNIPFSITSGIRFFEQAHIKDVAAWLKFVWNPRDEISLKRLVQLLPGVGAKTADKLWRAFADRRAARGEGQEPEEGQGSEVKGQSSSPLAEALGRCATSVPKKATREWGQLVATIGQLEVEPIRHQPAEMIRLVLEASYEDYLKSKYTNYRNRLEDLEQLANFAVQFSSTEEFLAQLALLTDVEAESQAPAARSDEQLRLSTIHQAKGLEFGVVFVIMLCDGLFPSGRSLDRLDAEEEERRLFYVAITRAKNELYLSYPLLRVTANSGALMHQASRFLADIPNELIEELTLKPFVAYRP